MRALFSLALIIIVTLFNVGIAARCVTIRNFCPESRYFSRNGEVKNISLYWGSDPARAASELLAIVLRDAIGYKNVRLQQGPHNLRDLATGVPFDSLYSPKDGIIALSVAWYAEDSRWTPYCNCKSGLAGPRLTEFGASEVPAYQRLHVHLAEPYKLIPECAKTTHWNFYTDAAAITRCGFSSITSGLGESYATVYALDWNNITMKELRSRAQAFHLRFQYFPLPREDLSQMLRSSNRSFLFVDYNIWIGHSKVNAVQTPPCSSGAHSTCRHELDAAISMRVADVAILEEFTPQLFELAHSFAPSLESIRYILEKVDNRTTFADAACDWAVNHTNAVETWANVFEPSKKKYVITVFCCEDDPDYKKYLNLFRRLTDSVFTTYYEEMFIISILLYPVTCDDPETPNDVREKIMNLMSNRIRQQVIGAVVGDMSNITCIVKKLDGLKVPVFLYDAASADVESATSVWLSTGRTRHLVLALRNFTRSMNWVRVAVLSEPTATAKDFFRELEATSGLALGEHILEYPLEAEKTLLKLKAEHVYIIFVNTNYKDADAILLQAAKLNMNEAQGYVWIARERRPYGMQSDLKHFTLSFWYQNGSSLTNSEGDIGLRQKLDKTFAGVWPSRAGALTDAILTISKSFYNAILEYPQALDDVHTEKAFHYFQNSVVDKAVVGTTHKLRYKKHSLEDTVVFIHQWSGNESELLARWHVNVTSGNVAYLYKSRDFYPQGNPPKDGSKQCIFSTPEDAYYQICHDLYWVIAILLLLVTPVTFVLAYRSVYRYLNELEEKYISDLWAWRQQRVAALSANFLVDRKFVELRYELGAGRFGFVRLAVLHVPGSPRRFVAAKALRDQENESEILREACTLAYLDHSHIIRLVGVCIDKDPPLVLMEVAFFGDLLQYLRSRRYLAQGANSEQEAETDTEEAVHVSAQAITRLGRQAASALGYLALQGVIHRDLRASNCLVDANRSLKLADFGLARETKEMGMGGAEYASWRGVVPALWMAPESLASGLFSPASDMWALGVLVFELVTLGARPYGDMSPLRVIQFVSLGGNPSMPRDATPQTVGLTRLCWQREPKERPSAAEVVAYLAEHPSALRPAFDYNFDQPPDVDSGFGELPMMEMLP